MCSAWRLGSLIGYALQQQQQQQQQQCIYLKKYKVYNTSCPANSYNANLGRTRL